MALTVQSIFNSLSIYRLKLVGGKEGLSKHVSWVYYTEDPETIEFIRGGELAITTCLNIERHKQNGAVAVAFFRTNALVEQAVGRTTRSMF